MNNSTERGIAMHWGKLSGAMTAMQLGRARHSLRPVALAAMASSCMVIAVPAAMAQQSQVRFDIPAQPLDGALRAFALQSGQQVLFDESVVAGHRAPALNGDFAPREALGRLIEGSGITVATSRPGVYTLRAATPGAPGAAGAAAGAAGAAAAPATLPSVVVEADADRSGTTEGTGSYTTRAMSTATRLDLSVRETPQSVSVITRSQMDDQGITDLGDVVKQAPGLTFDQSGDVGSDSSVIYSRGFEIDNYMVDGVPMLYSNYSGVFQTTDMALYDRVEVVRGATGLMSGVGSPGGTINLVRKRPTPQFQANAKVEIGSWDYYRAEADISTPLNESGSVRGRLVAAYQDNDTSIDRQHERRSILYGVVEADLTPRTLATFGFTVLDEDLTAHARSGRPLYFSDGSRAIWARSDSAAADWAYSKRKSNVLFASVEHRFDSDWMLKGTFNHYRTEYDEVLGYAAGGYADPATGAGMNLYAGRWAGQPTQDSFDIYARGPFTLGGRRHELVVGATASRTTDDTLNYNLWWFDDWDSSIPNIFTWQGSIPAQPVNPATGDWQDKERTLSAYATTRLKPTDALSVILGARVTSWREERSTFTYATGESTYQKREADGEVTPYAGLVYDIGRNWSVYGSFTNIFKPQSKKDAGGSYLDPEVGDAYELGTKAAFFDDRLNFSAAVYKVQQDNFGVAIPNTYAPDGSQAYEPASGTKTKGFELELAGQVTRQWQVGTAFSRNLIHDSEGEPLNTNLPQNTFKLFTSYRLPEVGNGLILGGGLRWQSGIYSDGMGPGGVRFEQDGYAVVDLMAQYAITPKVTAALNLYNVTDKTYYTSAWSSYYGAPRSARLSVNVAF